MTKAGRQVYGTTSKGDESTKAVSRPAAPAPRLAPVAFWGWERSAVKALAAAPLTLLLSCGGLTSDNRVGSETHFMMWCADDCPGSLECVHNVCTLPCQQDLECDGLGAPAVCNADACIAECEQHSECPGPQIGALCSSTNLCSPWRPSEPQPVREPPPAPTADGQESEVWTPPNGSTDPRCIERLPELRPATSVTPSLVVEVPSSRDLSFAVAGDEGLYFATQEDELRAGLWDSAGRALETRTLRPAPEQLLGSVVPVAVENSRLRFEVRSFTGNGDGSRLHRTFELDMGSGDESFLEEAVVPAESLNDAILNGESAVLSDNGRVRILAYPVRPQSFDTRLALYEYVSECTRALPFSRYDLLLGDQYLYHVHEEALDPPNDLQSTRRRRVQVQRYDWRTGEVVAVEPPDGVTDPELLAAYGKTVYVRSEASSQIPAGPTFAVQTP